MINVTLIQTALPHLLHGAIVSISLALCALLIGFSGGIVLAVLQTSGNRFLQKAIMLYTTIIRGTPMLIQIVFLYYLLPVMGIHISQFFSAVLAIGLNSSAYISQIIRAGILSINKGQIEAARTLGIPRADTIRYIILPQALRVVLPALGNESITLIKDSSLASLIGVAELYKEGQIVISQTYDSLSVYCALALIYLCITSILSYIFSHIEKRLNRHAHHTGSF